MTSLDRSPAEQYRHEQHAHPRLPVRELYRYHQRVSARPPVSLRSISGTTYPYHGKPQQTRLRGRFLRDRPLLVRLLHAACRRELPFIRHVRVSSRVFHRHVPRYSVPGATGKEVIIFDLYPDTGASFLHVYHRLQFAAGDAVLMSRIRRSYEHRRETYFRHDRDSVPGPCDVQFLYGMCSFRLYQIVVGVSDNPALQITSDVGFECWDGLFIPTQVGLS